jgi:hypothetical protein
MNNTGIIFCFDSNFDFKKNLRKKLSSKVLFWLGSGAESGSSILAQSGSTALVSLIGTFALNTIFLIFKNVDFFLTKFAELFFYHCVRPAFATDPDPRQKF